jgi:hypothetical protein
MEQDSIAQESDRMTPEQLQSVKELCEAAPSTFTLVGDGGATGTLTEDGYSVAFHSKHANWYGYLHPLQFLNFLYEVTA